MKENLLILDMDGTIIDTNKHYEAMSENYFKKLLAPLMSDSNAPQEIHEDVTGTTATYLMSIGMPEKNVSEALRIMQDTYARHAPEFINLIGMSQVVIDSLRRMREYGFKLILASNAMSELVNTFRVAFSLDDYFDCIISIPATAVKKNKCDYVNDYIHLYGNKPEKIICIGDTEADVIMAKKLGGMCCFMDTPISWTKDRHELIERCRPDFVAESFNELPELFLDRC